MREWFNDLNGHGDAAPWIDTGMTVTGGFMLGFGLTTQTKSDTRGSQQIFEVLGSSMGKFTLILERRGRAAQESGWTYSYWNPVLRIFVDCL